jgi:hypothetical protein
MDLFSFWRRHPTFTKIVVTIWLTGVALTLLMMLVTLFVMLFGDQDA